MIHAYTKTLSHLSWDAVFERQQGRAGLIADWIDGLQLQAGSQVLDGGCGPGFVTLELARLVGPHGRVLAVDTAQGALDALAVRQTAAGLTTVTPICADVADLNLPPGTLDSALLSMVLHHAAQPQAVVLTTAQLVRPGGRIVLAEFHPDGPSPIEPPHHERLDPATMREWCVAAGLTVLAITRQTPDHVMLIAERPAVES